MKFSVMALIVVGLVAAFSAALLVATMNTRGTQRAEAAEREVDILVAVEDLPAVVMLAEEHIEVRTIKASQTPEHAMKDPVQVVGKVLTRPVLKGQPLTGDCFAAGRMGAELVAMLPEGNRAVTVDLSLAQGLEGILYPGCIVDIIAAFDVDSRDMRGAAVSTTLLQGVKVLAIDDDAVTPTDGSEHEEDQSTVARRRTRRVTFAVDSEQAEALQLASEHGTISLALRNPNDTSQPDDDPTLLSGGRLAGWAEYLKATVAQGEDDTEGSVFTESLSTVEVDDGQRWEIVVHRGDSAEVKTFEEGNRQAVANLR